MQQQSALISVSVLRECFRNLHVFRATYESDGVDVLSGPDGLEVCLWDIEYLYSQIHLLPKRQEQAIRYFLVANLREDEVAQMMGTAPNNPIGMYATAGLNNLVKWIEEGRFPRFKQRRWERYH